MKIEKAKKELLERYVTVVLRTAAQEKIEDVAAALFRGGLSSFEVTFESPLAAQSIKKLKALGQDWLVGAGTVLDLESAKTAIEAGADFIFCPHLDLELLHFAKERDILLIPGILTPSELVLAWQNGASLVKVFPASLLGSGYLKALRGPFPDLKCIPTGGISADNILDFIKAGASGIGMGGALVDKKAIGDENWEALTAEAKKIKEIIISQDRLR